MEKAFPQVQIVASTFTEEAADSILEEQVFSSSVETLTVLAGRSCYQSFDRPNPQTALDKDYLERTLFEQGHWSIAEHSSATFYITGVSRAFTHELVRHRHLSFSQLSQRFVDESGAKYVVPPAIRGDDYLETVLDEVMVNTRIAYNLVATNLQNQGVPRKQAREAARAVLPNMTETKIVVTGNLRAWHEVTQRRMQPDADAEMQEVMRMIYKELNFIAPAIFPELEGDDE